MRVRVGDYELLARLGEGGMGVVHLAQRPGGDRIALKVLRPHIVGDQEARARLAREVGSLRRIRSGWVAEIIDADPWAEIPYVATRYVPGPSLHDLVKSEGPIRGREAIQFAGGLAEGVRSVHRAGVLHRDVKPSNVLMEGRKPILIDFGLARVADDPRLTHTGWLLGTPGYLAPEILYGEDATTASDVHSWAATVAFAGTGRSPFGGGPGVAIMDRVRRGEHDLSGLDPALRALVDHALAPDPRDRPRLDELLADLAALYQGRQPLSSPPEDPYTLPLAIASGDPLPARPTPVRGVVVSPRDTVVATLPPAPAPVPLVAPVGWAERLRRGILVGSLALWLTGTVAAFPYLGGAALVLLAWLLRCGSVTRWQARHRRLVRGPRWYDVPQAALSAPWYLLQVAPGTLLLTGWGLALAGAGGLIGYAASGDSRYAVPLGAAGLVLGLWTGPGAARVRGPVGAVVRPVAASAAPWLVACLVILAVAGLFGTLAAAGPDWIPARHPLPAVLR